MLTDIDTQMWVLEIAYVFTSVPGLAEDIRHLSHICVGVPSSLSLLILTQREPFYRRYEPTRASCRRHGNNIENSKLLSCLAPSRLRDCLLFYITPLPCFMYIVSTDKPLKT